MDEATRGVETPRQNLLEVRVGSVADGDPQYSRRRSQLFKQGDKVAIFGHHHGAGFSRRQEDLAIRGLAQRPGSRTAFASTPNFEESHEAS